MNSAANAQTPARVVILGAGVSGLAAGLLLLRLGYDVLILEARNGPGGRVLTLRDGLSEGMYAEAGATFIHVQHTLALDVIRQLGLNTLSIDMQGLPTLYLVRGQRIVFPPPKGQTVQWPFPLTAEEQQLSPPQLAEKYTQPVANMSPIDPYGPAWPPADVAAADTGTLAKLMLERGASMGAVELLSVGLNSLAGYGPETYSALLTLAENWFLAHHGPGLRIQGGNDHLPRAMAARLGNRVKYGTVVRKVAHLNDWVCITVEQGGHTSAVEAEHCLCTIPFSVLRDVRFEPPLSPTKAAAVQTFPYTAVTRIFCEFSESFWMSQGLSGLAITDLPAMVTYSDFGVFHPRGILQIYTAGERAAELAGLNEKEREDFALGQLDCVFPGYNRGLFVGSVSKSWNNDPYSRGAYPWFLPGQMSHQLGSAIAPHGQVHFAGDHCSVLPGWIEGALRSSLHAVGQMTGIAFSPANPPAIC